MRNVAITSMMLVEAFYSYLRHCSTLVMPDGVMPIKIGLHELEQVS